MEDIRRIAHGLCGFGTGYALKVRTDTNRGAVRVWIDRLDYENFHARAHMVYWDPLATFSAATDGSKRTTFSVTPWAFPWLSISLFPRGKALTGSASLEYATRLSERVDVRGRVSLTHGSGLPEVSGVLAYEGPYFGASLRPLFRAAGGSFAAGGCAVFSVFYDTFLARLVGEAGDDESLLALLVKFRDTRAGLITSTKEAASLGFETRIGQHWSAGLNCTQIFAMHQSMWKVFSSTSLGLRYAFPGGHAGIAWQRPSVISTKAKYRLSDKYKVGVTARIEYRNFSNVRIGIALHLRPYPEKPAPGAPL